MSTEDKIWLPQTFREKKSDTISRFQPIYRRAGFSGKTLWDWLQLLIIPLVLVGSTILFSIQQHQTDLQIAFNQQQETTLQDYLDHMSDLLLNYKLLDPTSVSPVREVARIRTLTALSRLDAKHKGILLQFLHESSLINKDNEVVILVGADLSGADLSGAILGEDNLSGADMPGADLSGADLTNALFYRTILNDAVLNNAHLIGAQLQGAHLIGAHLTGAYLTGANIGCITVGRYNKCADLRDAVLSNDFLNMAELKNTNLSGADLSGADLDGADLSGANLDGADLSGADLLGASVSNEQLAEAKSLRGALMPDGSTHR